MISEIEKERLLAEGFMLLFTIGSEMRKLQKDYFRTRDKNTLAKAKKVEADFDELLGQINNVLR